MEDVLEPEVKSPEELAAEKLAAEETQPLYSFELDDEEIESVKKTVVESNKGKAEDELTDEIAAANVAALEAKQTEAAPVLAKMEELAKLEENKDKTETEILELASAAIADASEEGEGEEGLGADFFGTKGAEAPPVVGEDPAPKAVVELPEDVKSKVAKYDAIENDVVYKAYLNAKENNADIDLVDLIVESGLTNNPANIADPAYFKELELNELRKDDPSITDDEIKDFLEEFKDKSKIAQWSEVKGTKDLVMSQYQNAKAVLATKVSSNVEASTESSKRIVAEAETELKSYAGKFRSVEMTEAQSTKVLNSIRSGNFVVVKDGKVDVARTVEVALKDALEHDVANAAYQRGKRDAERKATLRSGKPLRGLKVRSSAPKSLNADPRAEFKKNKAAMEKARGLN
jgi:hypothetical protein